MNSTRQIVRWSLPGLIFVLNLLVLHGLWLAIVEHLSPWALLNEATAPALIAVVAGGLPGGFLLYQFYFYRYRPVGALFPFIRRPRFFRRDRGGAVLRLYYDTYGGKFSLVKSVDEENVTKQKFLQRVRHPTLSRHRGLFDRPKAHLVSDDGTAHPAGAAKPWNCLTCRDIYTDRSDRNWILLQTMIDFGSGNKEFDWVRTEYTSGSDLYHGLGASRTAVLLAAFGAIVYDVVLRLILGIGDGVEPIPHVLQHGLANITNYLWALATIGVLVSAQAFVLWKCRDQVSRVYERRIAAALAIISRR